MVDDAVRDQDVNGLRVQPTKIIAFSGSVESTPDMDAYVERAIEKAIQQKNLIMFGDNPNGIDWVILNYIWNNQDRIGEKMWTICVPGNTTDTPRNMARFNQEPVYNKWRYEQYHKRDCDMVDFADVTIAIWNGKDRGTKAVFDYAKSINRQAWLVTFDRSHKVYLEDSLK